MGEGPTKASEGESLVPSEAPGIFIGVEGPNEHVAPDGKESPHFTIVCVPTDRLGRHAKLDRNWLNECVAVDGRILKLLEANTDEVLTDGVASGSP